MSKVQLTLSTKYVPNWGAWEGIREIIQNAADAHDDNHEMKVTHSGDTLRVTNSGVKLDMNVWLIGHTTKADGHYRGKFGEGLNLGIMALIRAGHHVKIVNDDESWTPKMEASEAFAGADVLTIYTRSRKKSSNNFSVEISGVDDEIWNLMKPRFLFLSPSEDSIKTSHGEVLLGDANKGRLYVRGIYVQTDTSLNAGYNFHDVSVDRDRKMVNSWDVRYYCARAWEEAMTTHNAKVSARVWKMLENGDPDVENFGDRGLDETVSEGIADVFRETYGKDAIPVSNMAESRESEHFGKRGVVVPKSLTQALKDTVSSIENERFQFKESLNTTYSWHDLNEDEQSILSKALSIVENTTSALGYAPIEERTTIVDFNDESLMGTFKGGDIRLARKILSDFSSTIRALVHEVSHECGGDANFTHEAAEGTIYSDIITKMVFSN